MNKSTNFSGKPIISQVLDFIPKDLVYRTAKEHNSDRYCKKFTTHDHLITMLYGVLSDCTSLRELSTALLGCGGKISHLGINYFPKRSTLSDANSRRNEKVFEQIYFELYKRYARFLSDSSMPKNLFLVDSTTVTLFSSVLKGVGRSAISGKKKGGLKIHTVINASEDVPCLIKLSQASSHDNNYLKHINLPKQSWLVFDKGYTDYKQYKRLTNQGINFVTRERDNAKFKSLDEYELSKTVSDAVLKDEKVEVNIGYKQPLVLRRIAFWDATQNRLFVFITNNHSANPDEIAAYYKNRWQIELLFKRLKQNFPLKYFLGDSANAIKIQVWICLIAQLILKLIQLKANRKWSFSTMASLIKFHLLSYIKLFEFLKNPHKNFFEITTLSNQTKLLFSG
jgi:hypothetical protein